MTLAARDKETGRLVGDFVLILRSVDHLRGEVGYVLHPDFAGRGLATEGARHMLHIAFDLLGLRRVIGRIDARNVASARVLTKIGMRHEAHLVQNELFKGEWTDEDDFAMLRASGRLLAAARPHRRALAEVMGRSRLGAPRARGKRTSRGCLAPPRVRSRRPGRPSARR